MSTAADEATYANALPDVDLGYRADGDGTRDYLTLHAASAPTTYSFDVTASNGVSLAQSPTGVAVMAGGQQVATIQPPNALDEAGVPGPVSMALATTGSGWTITLTLPQSWLSDPTRTFPVVVDPNITVAATTMCTINNLAPTTAQGCGFAYATNVYSNGTATQQIENGLVQFNLSSVPFDSDITQANVSLIGTETNGTIGPAIGPAATSWTSGATWADSDGVHAWSYPVDQAPAGNYGGGNIVGFVGAPYAADYDGEHTSTSSTASGSTVTWNYDQSVVLGAWIANQAYNNPGSTTTNARHDQAANYGLLLSESQGPPGANQGRGYYVTSAKLIVTYTPRTGLFSGVNYDQHRLNDRSNLYVNPTNQNGVYRSSDADVKGTGLAMTVNHYYNTASGAWTLNVGGDVAATKQPDGSVQVTLPSGTVNVYRPSNTGMQPPPGTGTCNFIGGTGRNAAQGPFSSSFTAPPGADADLCYLSSNNWYLLTDHHSGETLIFGQGSYSIAGSKYMLTDDIDRNGGDIHYTYGPSGSYYVLTGITDTQNRSYTVTASAGGHVASVSGPNGSSLARTWTYNWDSANANQLDSYTDAAGKTTHYSYNSAGLLNEIQTPGVGAVPAASETDLVLSGSAVTSVTQKDSDCTVMGSNPAGSCVTTYAQSRPSTSTRCAAYGTNPATMAGCATVTDADGHQTSYGFDEVDSTVKAVDGRNNVTSTSYNSDSNIASFTGATTTGGTETTSINYGTGPSGTADKVSSASQPTGAAGGFNYSPSNSYQPGAVNDTQGNCSSLTYDNSAASLAGNTTQITAGGTSSSTTGTCGTAGSAVTTNKYQGDSGVSSCLAAGGPWPGKGELCSTTNPDSNTTTYSYDAVGNASGSTPPGSSNTTTAATAGSTLKPSTQTVDAVSRVATTTDGNGNTTAYWYDANDRVIEVNYSYSGSYDPTTPPTCVTYTNCTTFAYDPDGNLVTQNDATGTVTNSYDQRDHLVSTIKPGTATKSYGYDDVGNLISYGDQAGTVTYNFDAANDVLSAANTSAGSTSCPAEGSAVPVNCVTYGYDADHRRTGTEVPGGVTQTVAYDKSGRPTSVTTTSTTPASGVTPLGSSITYGYQNPSTKKDTDLVQARDGGTISYDSLNRVTGASYDGHSWSYTYDQAGNRLTSSADNGPTTYYTYNSGGELCWTSTTSATGCASPPTGAATYTYDQDGNQLTGLVGGTGQTLSYDDKNFMVGSAGPSTYAYSYSGLDQTNRTSGDGITIDNSALGVVQAGASTFGHLPGGTLTWMVNGSSVYYYLYDGYGNVIGLVDANSTLVDSYTYDPYGTTTPSETVSQPFRYRAGYQDATGLYHFGARYYDPTTGRFTQLDPSGQTPGYGYAADNPITNSDPSGMCDFESCVSTIYNAGSEGAYAGLLLGGIGGALIGGLATGGIGAVPGAVLGAGEGGFGGAIIGTVVGIGEDIASFF